MGETLASLLARVRAALGGATQPSDPPAVPEELVRLASCADDVTALFLAQAAGIGLVAEALGASHAARRVSEILRACDVRRVAVEASLGELEAHLREDGFDIDGPDALYDTEAGITGVEAALAETGTIVLRADSGLALVPPLHVALLFERDIVPDMLDYFRGGPTGPRVFVTGPSKTADIEGELITGVHGPGRVHVLVLLAGDQEDDRRVVEQVHEHPREEAVAAGA